jgi:hypothetical protein
VVPSCIVALYCSYILLFIAACTGLLTGDHTDEAVVLRGPGWAMFPLPPWPRHRWLCVHRQLCVHGILPVLMHWGQHRSLSSWVNGTSRALHTLCVLCKERVCCPVLMISSASLSVTCTGPLTWVHADVEVASGWSIAGYIPCLLCPVQWHWMCRHGRSHMLWVQVWWAMVFMPWHYAGVCVLDCGTLKQGTLYRGVIYLAYCSLSGRFTAVVHSLPSCLFLIPLQSLVCAQCWSFSHHQQWCGAMGQEWGWWSSCMPSSGSSYLGCICPWCMWCCHLQFCCV